MLNRRHLLCCGAAAGLFTSLAAPARAGLANPCRSGIPDTLKPLVARCFDGLDPAQLWDVHTHLLGTGDSGSGCTVNAQLSQWWHPVEMLRKRFILNAACVPADAPSVDRAYVERLRALADGFPEGARWMLFAFDHACDDAGRPHAAHTTFHVPDAYAAHIAAAHPQRFAWVASIHPYRPDALARLDAALAGGAVALKWLPSSMNIDLRDVRLRPFYDRLAAARLPVIVHCGEERAVPGAGRDDGACVTEGMARAGASCGARLGVRRGVGRDPQRAGNDAWPRKSPRPFGLSLARAHAALLVVAGTSPRPPRALPAPLPGSTRAMPSVTQAPGNPLLVRAALERGVRVVIAHCASLGSALDLDRARPRDVPAFSLFTRLMDEDWGGRLMGDISVTLQTNRDPDVARTLLAREDWHARLLHGSDYPLPGIPAAVRLPALVDAGLLDAADAPALDALRGHNPLLFDLALKRLARWRGARLSPGVFATRAHFDRPVVS